MHEVVDLNMTNPKYLRVITIAIISGFLSFFILRRFHTTELLPLDVVLLALSTIYLGIFVLILKNRLVFSSLFLLAVTWIGLAIIISLGQGIYDIGIMAFVGVTLMVELTVIRKLMPLLSLITIIFVWILAYFYTQGYYPAELQDPYRYARNYTIIIFVLSCIVWAYSQLRTQTVVQLREELKKREAADAAIVESERVYREAIEAINGVPYVDSIAPRCYTFMGKGILKLTGYSASEMTPSLMNSMILKAIPMGELSGLSIDDALTEIKKQKLKTWICDLHIVTKNGEERWLTDNAILLYDEKGNSTGSIGILTDISERRKNELELIAAKEKAEEINKLKSVFFANMSHELRTPLMGIQGYAEVLAASLEDDELKGMAETIKKSSNRLKDTLKHILDISKLESEKVQPQITTVDLLAILQESSTMFQESAWVKNLSLELLSPSQPLYVLADRKMLEDIINNIVNNAIKFTNNGGVTISAELQGSVVVVKVVDTGVGISEKSLEVIFEEFRQESEGLSRSFEGTGLGLTIAKKYAQLMNCTIEVDSKIQQGSIFTIALPAATPKNIPGLTGGPAHNLQIAQDKLSVLLVEDDEVTMHLINRFISPLFIVHQANNAADALRIAEQANFHIILMDINLGKGMNGLQVANEIRKLAFSANIPIVAMTAFAMDGDREDFLANGCSHYIAKPFSRNELIQFLREILQEYYPKHII